MKKTLLATAIAGAMGLSAASAQAATVYNQDGTKLDIYGNIQIAYRSIDEGANTEDDIFDNGSTIGVAGEHVINPGLVGYFKAEWEHDADEEKISGGINTGDQAYVGLRGDFGDARLGSYDPLIDDWIQDPITNNEYFDVSDSSSVLSGGDREGDKITYTSPVFSGFQFAVGTQYKGEAESENVTDSGNASFFGGARYTVGAFSIAAAYDNLDNYEVINAAAVAAGDYGDQYGVTAQYTIDSLRLAAKVERFDADAGNSGNDVDFYGLSARYGYGVGDVYGAYQRVEEDNSDDRDEFMIGATYNVSDAMYTFVEAAWYDENQDEGDGVAVGVTYLF